MKFNPQDIDLQQQIELQRQQQRALLQEAASIFANVQMRCYAMYCTTNRTSDDDLSARFYRAARGHARNFIMMKYGDKAGPQLLKLIDPPREEGGASQQGEPSCQDTV